MQLSLGEIVYAHGSTTPTPSFGKMVSILNDGRYRIQSIHAVLNKKGRLVPDAEVVLPTTFIITSKGEHKQQRYKRYVDVE